MIPSIYTQEFKKELPKPDPIPNIFDPAGFEKFVTDMVKKKMVQNGINLDDYAFLQTAIPEGDVTMNMLRLVPRKMPDPNHLIIKKIMEEVSNEIQKYLC